jgi:hypothetical protein
MCDTDHEQASPHQPNNKFVMIERWFWRTPAWNALPHAARSLYVEIEMLYTGSNNGEIALGVRKAAELISCSINYTRKMSPSRRTKA